jgi:hypothetical protein
MGVFMKNKLLRTLGIVALIFVLGFSSASAGTHKVSSGKHKNIKHERQLKKHHKAKAKAKKKAKKVAPAKKPVKEINEDDLPDDSTEAEHPG